MQCRLNPGATCLRCDTAPIEQASTQDMKLLKAAKEKQLKKNLLQKKQENKQKEKETKLQENVGAQEEVSVLNSAALSCFKMPKKMRYALSQCQIRPGRQTPSSPGQQYLETTPCQPPRVCLLGRDPGPDPWPPEDKRQCQPHCTKQPFCLSKGTMNNISSRTVQQLPYYSEQTGTPSFQIEEVSNILFLCGRKMSEDPTVVQPSIHKQDNHWLLKDAQKSRYMFPVLSPHTVLGVAVAQEIHDQSCGSSPATRYFYFCPSAGNLFRNLQENCFKCIRIRMIRGDI